MFWEEFRYYEPLMCNTESIINIVNFKMTAYLVSFFFFWGVCV